MQIDADHKSIGKCIKTRSSRAAWQCCFALALLCACSSGESPAYKRMYRVFQNPPSSYSPAVYWFWNGTVTDDGIRSQLEEMQRSGTVGTVCILAWEGLAIEYLSDEWFAKVKYACSVAKKLGLDIWLYDEIRWPSGYAGGKVLRADPDYRARCLSRSEKSVTGPAELSVPLRVSPVAVVAGALRDGLVDPTSLRELSAYCHGDTLMWPVPEGDWRIWVFSEGYCDFRPNFLGEEYVDLLNADAVGEFIRLTHDEYYRRMPEYFGDVIKAIITDEPGTYCNLKAFNLNPETAPWTPSFLQEFSARKGYDLRTYLPALWCSLGDSTERIRLDYYEVLTELFQSSYFAQLHDWCAAHDIKLNIQPSHEETLKFSTLLQGDYFMAMEFSDLPGADEVYSWDRRAITPKLASSAARAFGSQEVYCEVFGAYGWDVSLEEMKAVTDWLFSRGVNHLMLSGFYFAGEGEWRFEVPPSLFTQNTQWPYLPYYTEYCRRLSSALSGGRHVAPIGVVYPSRTAQAQLSATDEFFVDRMDTSLQSLSELLLGVQYDFDYLDERSVAEKAAVVQQDGAAKLRINNRDFSTEYQLIILPYVRVLEREAIAVLREFQRRGGTILAFGEAPAFHTALDAAGIQLLAQDPEAARGKLSATVAADFELKTPNKNLNHIHKVKNGLDIYFIANTDSAAASIEAAFAARGRPYLWNPEDGSAAALSYRIENGRTVLPLSLDRYGSQLIVFDGRRALKTGEALFARVSPEDEAAMLVIELNNPWRFSPADGFFEPELRESGSWTEAQFFRLENGEYSAPAHPYFSGTGIYAQEFFLDSSVIAAERAFILSAGAVKNVLDVRLNGLTAGVRCWPPYTLDISDYIKAGTNSLELWITNTPANRYALREQDYWLGEKWGKIQKSGLIETVKIRIFDIHEETSPH